MTKLSCPLPIFDTVEKIVFDATPSAHLQAYSAFKKDYLCAHAFLYAYKDNKATFNTYRREVERLLLWAWMIHKKPILDFRRLEIETYLKFCQKPPKNWIGLKKAPHFLDKEGQRIPHPDWRPFVARVSKVAIKRGETPNVAAHKLSNTAFKDIFAILSSFYNFLIQESYTEVNPLLQIRQKSQFIRKQQTTQKIRRLTELQWQMVIETAQRMAAENPDKHERALFIMSALYAMYLRISELVASHRWIPKMCDFYKDSDGNWWFITAGKGNKERQIAVSNSMLMALKRWRKHLGLTPLPSLDDKTPLISKEIGQGPITSTNRIRNLVQFCFDEAITRLTQEGFKEEADGLQSATVHWLRHTGISDDVKRRPREHVRDDAGHSSSAITDKYIDIELRERHASAKNKPLS